MSLRQIDTYICILSYHIITQYHIEIFIRLFKYVTSMRALLSLLC
jgi:hypothetical protein